MRTGAAIFLLLLLVSVHTPIGQFLKLPMLVEHFIKHQNNNATSLIGFLEEHYSAGHDDADRMEDEQLPFKSITFFAIGYAVVPATLKTGLIAHLPETKKVDFPDTYALQQHVASIFHPPRA
jgi:hypothetical protein